MGTATLVAVTTFAALMLQGGSDGGQRVEFDVNDARVASFGYVLQYDRYGSKAEAVAALASSGCDLLVLDAFFSAGQPWTPADLPDVRGDAGKVLLAYVSIGEAESYRDYWDEAWDADGDGAPDAGAPAWLDEENPDWPGNYKVRYWDPAWQDVVLEYLAGVLVAGFDGAYLDVVDAYEYYEEGGRTTAADEMVQLVSRIANFCRSADGDFLVVPQNAEELAFKPGYLDEVDGIGREDLLFTGDVKNPAVERSEAECALEAFLKAGKFVLEVEYPTLANNAAACRSYARDMGYLLQVCPRGLDAVPAC
ncbi:MAG: endo alpha-1,4 polygalactosaminidase [Promethearchaeota archaeon]